MFKVNKKDTNMKRQRGGGVFIINFKQISLFFLNVSTVDFEQHICLLNYSYKTINMFRKTVENKI